MEARHTPAYKLATEVISSPGIGKSPAAQIHPGFFFRVHHPRAAGSQTQLTLVTVIILRRQGIRRLQFGRSHAGPQDHGRAILRSDDVSRKAKPADSRANGNVAVGNIRGHPEPATTRL